VLLQRRLIDDSPQQKIDLSKYGRHIASIETRWLRPDDSRHFEDVKKAEEEVEVLEAALGVLRMVVIVFDGFPAQLLQELEEGHARAKVAVEIRYKLVERLEVLVDPRYKQPMDKEKKERRRRRRGGGGGEGCLE